MLSAFIMSVLGFILSIILKLLLHSLKLTLALIQVPAQVASGMAMSHVLSKSNNGKASAVVTKSAALASYLALQALIVTLTVISWVLDLLLTLFIILGAFWGSVVILLLFLIVVAGAYIIVLNNCTTSAESSSTATKVVTSEGTTVTKGDSASAGMGEFTEEAKNWASSWNLTYIGDSLGAGSQSYFTSLFPNAVYDSDPSRGVSSIKGQNTGESGVETLKRLVSEGKVGDNLVVALGTNNDVSLETLQEFYGAIPSNVKTITWVLTASEGGVDNGAINSLIKDFVNSHDNMRYLDWKSYVDANGGWSSYQGGDNIHMSSEGAEKYAKFQAQGLYDLYGKGASNSTGTSASGSASSTIDSLLKSTGILADSASKKLSVAFDLTVQAAEDATDGSSSEEEDKNCVTFTSSVSTSSATSGGGSTGGSLQGDGTGTHTQAVPAGWGLAWKPSDLPEELKKYALDPTSIGIQYGSAWGGSSASPNESGWLNFTDSFGAEWAGQCTEFAATMQWHMWSKDGANFHNTAGDGAVVAPNVASKAGISVTQTPKAGATFSTSDGSYGHVGIVSHVFENGDVLIIEQNISGYSGYNNGTPNTWNYRLVASSSVSSQFNVGFAYLGDAGYQINPNLKTLG